MLTRLGSDACTIGDQDWRNSQIYEHSISNLPDFRRMEPLEAQQYATQSGGLERNWSLDSKLRGLEQVDSQCNSYGISAQAEIQAAADPTRSICMGNALAPTYSRGTRVARQHDIYESKRAKPMDWHFYSPSVRWPTYGVYEVNRWTDTAQNAKDALEAANKQMLQRQYKGFC
jgi:hypothetical protein